MDQDDPFPEDFVCPTMREENPIYLVLGSKVGFKGYLQSA